MEGGGKVGVPHEMSSTQMLKDTISDECFGQSLGGTIAPELVVLQSEKWEESKEKAKSVKEL